MDIHITSDGGRIGQFLWFNGSNAVCTFTHNGLDIAKINLQLFGCVKWGNRDPWGCGVTRI